MHLWRYFNSSLVTVNLIILYLTNINRLFTNTYKREFWLMNPMLQPTELHRQGVNALYDIFVSCKKFFNFTKR